MIDLTKLLARHIGKKFYCSLAGCQVVLEDIDSKNNEIIVVDKKCGDIVLTGNGRLKDFPDGELILFPEEKQRDWAKWEVTANQVNCWKDVTDVPYYNINLVCDQSDFCDDIDKAVAAMFKIYTIIKEGYGGLMSYREIETNGGFLVGMDSAGVYTYVLEEPETLEELCNRVFYLYPMLCFRTVADVERFLSYPENVELIKDLNFIKKNLNNNI